jgi:hypothetical protein
MNFNSDDLLELERYLKLNRISKEDICLVGSTTLSLIGIRAHNDIDFVLHSKYKFPSLSLHSLIERVNNPWSTLFTDDELIENSNLHITYNGFKFVIPELVFHKKIWHNRLKDQSDIIELREYAKMHKNWKWELLKDALPTPSLIKIFIKKCTNRFKLYNNRISDYFRFDNNLNKDGFQMISTSHLLAKQVVNQSFNRYDLVVRYMAISSFLNNDNIGISLYQKMQENRGGSAYENPWKIFKDLIINIKDNGFDISQPILVNKEMHIVDGAHRLACALYFNEPFIPVKINKKLSHSLYGISWFTSHDFNSSELAIIEDNKQSLFMSNHLFFEVILWPPVSKYFDEIEELIGEKFTIISSKEYNDILNFNTYIKALYKIDDIKDWKVDLKIQGMSAYPKDIRIIKIEILEPNFRHKANNHLISKAVEELKEEIRTKYKSKVDNYFHDIIIHIGDNYSHSKQSSLLEINV